MIHQELWKTLTKLNPRDVSRRSLAVFDSKTQSYDLKIFSRSYVVVPPKMKIHTAGFPDEQAPFYLQLAAVNYLIGAKNIPLDGRWVSEKEFPSGPLFFRGPHAMPAKKLLKTFGSDRRGFVEACLFLGGNEIDGGDAAFEFYAFPRLPLRLILWLADDEFPARITYLFDRTANVHLKLDAVWTVGNLIESELIKTTEKDVRCSKR